jgi:hypothetical protein
VAVFYFRSQKLASSVSNTLTTIIEVMGTKIRLLEFWILISPGNLPNQLISQGAYLKIKPSKTMPRPNVMSSLPVSIKFSCEMGAAKAEA